MYTKERCPFVYQQYVTHTKKDHATRRSVRLTVDEARPDLPMRAHSFSAQHLAGFERPTALNALESSYLIYWFLPLEGILGTDAKAKLGTTLRRHPARTIYLHREAFPEIYDTVDTHPTRCNTLMLAYVRIVRPEAG